nr:hypothetical protein [Tanacetum cinerariifolium]
MEDDLFTYQVEITEVTNIPCDLKKKEDLEQQMLHESDNDMEYDPFDPRGNDEVELTGEESSNSDDEDEVAKIFRIETNVFKFETPLCRAFKEFNYLLQIDPDVHEGPWTENGVWKEPTPVKHHYLERYEALNVGKLKKEALKNKAIMDEMIDEDEESSNEGWKRWDNFDNTNRDNKESKNEMEHGDEERSEVFDDHERQVCYIRRFEMIKYSFRDDKEYVAIKENEYDDLTNTSKKAIFAYQEIFRMMTKDG